MCIDNNQRDAVFVTVFGQRKSEVTTKLADKCESLEFAIKATDEKMQFLAEQMQNIAAIKTVDTVDETEKLMKDIVKTLQGSLTSIQNKVSKIEAAPRQKDEKCSDETKIEYQIRIHGIGENENVSKIRAIEDDYKDYKVFVSRGLSKEEIAQHNAILKKRFELISAGASRESLSIRNLTLYKDGKKYELIQEDQ